VHQGVALAEHLFELGLAPAAMERSAVQPRQRACVAHGRRLDHRGTVAPQAR